jgi:hypothetical protein
MLLLRAGQNSGQLVLFVRFAQAKARQPLPRTGRRVLRIVKLTLDALLTICA